MRANGPGGRQEDRLFIVKGDVCVWVKKGRGKCRAKRLDGAEKKGWKKMKVDEGGKKRSGLKH